MPTILDQLLGNGGMSDPNAAQQILSARFQQPQDTTGGNMGMQMPNMQPPSDAVAESIFRNTAGFNGNPNYTPVSPQQVYGQGQMAMIQPQLGQAELQQRILQNNLTQQTALPKSQAEMALQNAQANYYQNALQRDIAEKAFAYANDPQMAQARMMAQYMASLSGQAGNTQAGVTPISAPAPGDSNPAAGTPIPNPPTPDGIQISGNAPLNQAIQQNATTAPTAQGGGFNPMGAMLAKSLGLTDMQIGPNGQPMPIPGSMKVENGSVISFDQNGKPQSNIPINPRAQGLFEQKLQDIYDNVNKLHDIGGMVDENNSWLSNKAKQIAASPDSLWGIGPGGQTFMQGTPAQTLRDNITADVKQALPLYMQAFGITPGMERAQAAQQMLQDAIGGSLTKSRQHTMANLKNLSQTAGTGKLAAQLSRVNVVSPDGQAGSIAPEELQSALANGWKQVQ